MQTIYDRAIQECYAASIAPGHWPVALHMLVDAFGSSAAMFYPKDVGASATAMPATEDYLEVLEDYVAGEWYVDHYRADRGWPLLASGQRVILEHDLATDEERRQLPTYNDFYLKWGYSGFAAIGFFVDGDPWCLPMLRKTRDGFFDREEASRMERLAPHLRRMVKMASLYNKARGFSGLEMLDALSEAAILFAADGRIMEVNSAAGQLISRNGDALIIKNLRLYASHNPSNSALQHLLLHSALEQVDYRHAGRAVPIPIQRPRGRPLVAEVVNLPSFLVKMNTDARVMLLLRDPDLGRSSRSDTLKSIFGLSEAEARLAVIMANGDSIERASDFLGITRETARHRLKSIFSKTETHRQGELVAVLRNVLR